MSTDLIAFLRARLDEDEATARAVVWDGSGNGLSWGLAASATVEVGDEEFNTDDRTVANHIVNNDPARVLAEVAAKLALVDDLLAERHVVCEDPWYTCGLATEERDGGECIHEAEQGRCTCGLDARRDRRLRLLALPYASHPDYREEWAVTAG